MIYNLILFLILLSVWIAYTIHTFLTWTIPVWKEKNYFEVYASFGMISFIGIITLEIFYWMFTGFQTALTGKITAFFSNLPLTSMIESILFIIGWAFWILGLSFLVGSFLRLKREGEPTDDWESTTKFVEKFPYSIVRHPMFCGASLFTLSFMCFFLTYLSMILGPIAIIFLYFASVGEDKFDEKKFPEEYNDYMKQVPRWNFVLGFYRSIKKNK